MSPRNLGLAIAAPFCWGVVFSLAKPVVTHFPPVFMLLVVYAIIGAIMAFTHRDSFKTPWLHLVLIASLSVTIQGACLFYAEKMLDATTTNLVLQVQVPAAALLGWLIAGEKLTANRLLGTIIALVGVGIVIGLPEQKPAMLPVLLVIASGFIWAAGQVFARLLAKDPGVMILKANAWFAAPQLLLLTLVMEQGQWQAMATATPGMWALLAIVCFFGFYLPYMMWFTLLRHVTVDQAVPFILLMTPFGIVGAMIFLGEQVTGIQLLGGAILMAGLAVVNGIGPGSFRRGAREPA
jgi:O-acetylserine/cysteine efflux transporter